MAPGSAEASPGVLNSWKEIAAYLDRDVRTVMRWEQTRGLPVHRLPGGPKSAIYALKSELDGWRRGRRLTLLEPAEDPHPLPTAPQRGAAARSLPRWAKVAVAVLMFGLLAMAGAIAVRKLALKPAGLAALPSLTRLTYDRVAVWPAISADGRWFAFGSDREGKFDIYLQQIGGHQPVRVTHNESDNWHPAFSPDGSRIAFRSDRDGGGLYLVETLGGVERKIADRGDFPSFSPDGSTIAFLVRDAFSGAAGMFHVPAAGGPVRPFQPDFQVPAVANAFTVPMWSPDGQSILFEGNRAGDRRTRGLWASSAAGDSAVRVEGMEPNPPGTIRTWLTWAGNYLYFVEGTSVQGLPLWRAPVAAKPWRIAGPPQRLTSSSTVCGSAQVSTDGRLVMMIAGSLNDVWSTPLAAGTSPTERKLRQETFGTDNKLAMSVASNGSRMAYIGVYEVGHTEIRLMDFATRRAAAVPLSGDFRGSLVRLSPDGARLGYRDALAGKLQSFVAPAENPAPADPVCEGCSLAGFSSRSGDLLVQYGPRLVRQNGSGTRTTLIEALVADPVLSPDDRWVAFVAPQPHGSAGLSVAAVGGQLVPREAWLPVAEDSSFVGSPQWSRDGRTLYYIANRDSFSCVWARSFDARNRTFGEPLHIYHDQGAPSLKLNPARSLVITPDRMYLLMTTMSSNIWTMKVE